MFNHCSEFQWSPEGPVRQIHTHLHSGAPGIFSNLLRSVQMLKSYRTYSSLVKLQPWFLSCGGSSAFARNCSLGAWVCSEKPVFGQNTLMMAIEKIDHKLEHIEWSVYRVSQKHRQLSACCAGRQTIHYSRRNPCPETHGLGDIVCRSSRTKWCHNLFRFVLVS